MTAMFTVGAVLGAVALAVMAHALIRLIAEMARESSRRRRY